MGRGKVELKRIENSTSRQVTFSKRKNGVLKKAFELSVLCDAEVALLIFSPSGKLYQFASDDLDRIISRYRNQVGLLDANNQRLKTVESWKREIEELKGTIVTAEARLRHFAGEDISTLDVKELRQLERQLKVGVERVRSKKRRVISEQMTLLKRRERALLQQNAHLQKRVIKLNELHDADTNLTTLRVNTCAAYQEGVVDHENGIQSQ